MQADGCYGDDAVAVGVQKCKRHRPEGCEGVYERLKCPVCLILPCLMILQKISNHLDLLKGVACTLHSHAP